MPGMITFCLLLIGTGTVAFGESPPGTVLSPVVERFLQSREADANLSPEVRDRILQQTRQSAARSESAHEAITQGLMIQSPEFGEAIKLYSEGQFDGASRLLKPLASAEDRYLAAEAHLLLARSLSGQGHIEEALPSLQELVTSRENDTVRLGEAWFLKGKLEAAAMQRDAARKSLGKFLDDFKDAPPRMRGEARATLIDLDDVESDVLSDLQDRMSYSGRKLGIDDAGDETREAQDQAVTMLTELIEELEKKSGKCKGCSSSMAGASAGTGGNAPGQSQGTSQGTRITERNAPRTPWVDLKQKPTETGLFNSSRSRVPVQYRGLVEQYYQSFGPTRDPQE